MDSFSAQPIPDGVSEQDWQMLHQLVLLVTRGSPVDDVLGVLRDHLAAATMSIYWVDDPLPGGDRVIVVPLYYRQNHWGDLVLEPPPGVDSVAMAARAAFFAPVLALMPGKGVPENADEPQTPVWQRTVYEERDRLEAILEATNDAILMIDPEGTVVTATLQFETFTGIPRFQVLGDHVETLVHYIEERPGLPAGMVNLLRSLVDNHKDTLGGEFIVLEPQRRVLVWYSLPIYARSSALLGRIFAFRDATRERESDRMKTEFITLVSHELRTPLTAVKGFSDLILDGEQKAIDPEILEYLAIIRENADRLVTLLNDILDVTRIESDRIELKPGLCQMPDVIRQAIASVKAIFKARRHTLRLDVERRLPPVWADQTRLVQILTHLLTNAIKYTLEPGRITIRARHIQQMDHLPAGASRNQILPCVLVTVEDTGMGIASKDWPHLFEQFYRADTELVRAGGGTGLGLTIVKAFVEMQGGQVWFESTVGEGSTFYFTVPVAEAKSPETG